MSTKEVSKRREIEKRRKPLYNDVSRFKVPKIPGMHVCIVEEIPGNIQRYIEAGYVFVKENTDTVFELDREQDLKESNQVWRVILNPSYHSAGSPMGIVLAIKQEWYEQDMEEKAVRSRNTDNTKDIKNDKI